MNLIEKLFSIYPTLSETDFIYPTGTIRLQDDSDGKGQYIKEWNHPTLPRPTEEQLK